MLGFNTIQEVFATLKQNKMRTVLTGLAVSWGIFILIVLIGAGNGLRNGVEGNFSSRAVNTVQMWPGWATKPYKGLKANRGLAFMEKELTVIDGYVPEADLQTGLIEKYLTITYKNEYGSFSLVGVEPSYAEIFNLQFLPGNGRFVNELDILERNKVIVLDQRVVDVLFKGEEALGKYVKVGSVMYRVVGINTKRSDGGSGSAYIPFSTAQAIYNPDKKFYSIAFTVNGLETKEANDAFNDRLKATMGQTMNFAPDDPQGLWIWNSQRDYIETKNIFGGINIFLTVIGIFTLLAGVVGISNIMLVSVKERTREIGIRKAIGAPPAAIIRSVIIESILITAIFGYIGMLLGIGLTEVVGFLLEQNSAGGDGGMSIFRDPTVNLGYVFVATAILIISGVIAGYIPARRAAHIKPIEAMREE